MFATNLSGSEPYRFGCLESCLPILLQCVMEGTPHKLRLCLFGSKFVAPPCQLSLAQSLQVPQLPSQRVNLPGVLRAPLPLLQVSLSTDGTIPLSLGDGGQQGASRLFQTGDFAQQLCRKARGICRLVWECERGRPTYTGEDI